MSRSAMHKYTTCTSFDYSHSTMQYDTCGGSLYYSTKIYTLQKSVIRIMVGVKTNKFILRWDIPIGVQITNVCLFNNQSHTTSNLCKCILAISFCSKSEPSSVHFTKTEKTEDLYNIRMVISPFSL